jgi:hypothetical protein
MQTSRAIVSLICRVVLLGIAVPMLLRHFPNYKVPYRLPTEWVVLTVCDAFAVLAPLLRTRKLAFLAGAATLGGNYYFRHYEPIWDLAYMAVAIVFVLLPSSGRGDGKAKANRRVAPGGGGRH